MFHLAQLTEEKMRTTKKSATSYFFDKITPIIILLKQSFLNT